MSRRRDIRRPALLMTVMAIVVTALAVRLLSSSVGPRPDQTTATAPPGATARSAPNPHPPRGATTRDQEIDRRFKQAVVMLHAREYGYALTALNGVLELAPEMPEAHANMGFAYLGLQNYPLARDFFLSALELRPEQTNAYWGLAVSLEALCDMPGALGAMRSYIHLSETGDPFLDKARSALWEWQAGTTTCTPEG